MTETRTTMKPYRPLPLVVTFALGILFLAVPLAIRRWTPDEVRDQWWMNPSSEPFLVSYLFWPTLSGVMVFFFVLVPMVKARQWAHSALVIIGWLIAFVVGAVLMMLFEG